MTGSMVQPSAINERPAPAQVLLRGLSLLEALNRRAVGSVEELAHDTRLPKSTVVRRLNTLVLAGYVRRLPKRGGYSLAERVLGLSWGFRSEDAVVEAARPLLAAFTVEHKWPVSKATLGSMQCGSGPQHCRKSICDRSGADQPARTAARLGTRARLPCILF